LLFPQAVAEPGSRPEERLAALAAGITAETAAITPGDSERALRYLTRIYAAACANHRDGDCIATATGYAGVVVALSQRFPELDYESAIGQLLELMIRLFKKESAAWVVVYQHLRAMPESVRAKQQLQRVCTSDIHEWFDAGVQNLFRLRAEIHERIAELGREADAIAEEIRTEESELAAAREQRAADGQVVVLAEHVKARHIRSLRVRRDTILEEMKGKAGTAVLVEDDIRQFERRLWDARRSYLLRLM
jgi:DNA-binding ferritin-like protein